MQIYSLPTEQNQIPIRRRAVALGIFDGIHLGHRAVISRATATGYPCAVYTFQAGTVTTKQAQPSLCPDDMSPLLQNLGVKELFEADFAAVQQLSPEEFVDEVLCKQLHAAAVTCGFNYRFGRGGSGDANTLMTLCANHGIAVTVVDAVEVDGIPVSSTVIRQAIANGDLDTARRMLGYNYSLRLPVVDGQHLGRRLGTPTINQILPSDRAYPPFGVYASCAIAKGHVYPAVTNLGRRPTVGAEAPLAETYIDGFDGDLYGHTVTVYPLRRLRDEEQFPSLDALKAQVEADIAAARALFTPPPQPTIRAILFDFDDTLGPRDPAFRRMVEAFLNRYYPDLPPAEFERRAREMITFNNYGYGMPITYEEYIRKYLTTWEPYPDVPLSDALEHFFLDYARFYKLAEDTVPTLQELRRRGFLLGVITNGHSRVQGQKLDHTDVRPLLDIGVVSGDEGMHKPDPELFRRIAARLGLPCECCLFVGDHPVNDVGGALAAGMQAVFMDAQFPADHPLHALPLPQGVPTVRHLAELLDLPYLAHP